MTWWDSKGGLERWIIARINTRKTERDGTRLVYTIARLAHGTRIVIGSRRTEEEQMNGQTLIQCRRFSVYDETAIERRWGTARDGSRCFFRGTWNACPTRRLDDKRPDERTQERNVVGRCVSHGRDVNRRTKTFAIDSNVIGKCRSRTCNGVAKFFTCSLGSSARI